MTDLMEAAYATALQAIAVGATRAETYADLRDSYSSLEDGHLREAMADALRDALKQGVEREDIDESWF
jgi:hypothetical protein